jgi:hypothetical protein
MRRRRRTFWRTPGAVLAGVAVGTTLCTACGGAEASAPRSAVRDSAGLTIVESSAYAWNEGEAWTLSTAPVVVIGGRDDPGHDLYRVRSALRLEDGRIVVANAGSAEIRFYDDTGRHLGSKGGRGDGPGEFRLLGFVARRGQDSLIAWDGRAWRLSVFDLEGTFAGSAQLENSRYRARPVLAGEVLLAGDVRRAVPEAGDELPRDVVVRAAREYALFSLDGSLVAGLGTRPDDEQWSSYDVDHPHAQGLLFGKRTVLAGGSLVWVGTGDAYQLLGYDGTGSLVKIVRNLAHEPERLFAKVVAARIAELQADWDEESAHMLPVYQGQQTPEFMAPFDRLVADVEGNLWARAYPVPGEAHDVWTVFDADGSLLGQVDMPYRFEVLDVGPDFVVGTSLDEMNLERVEVYALLKP